MTIGMLFVLTGCGIADKNKTQSLSEQDSVWKQTEKQSAAETGEEQAKKNEEESTESFTAEEDEGMRIKVTSEEYEIVYELNESQAAKDLYAQLPLDLEVQDFSTNEKTFYPPKELDISDAPPANADRGTLAYYSPWADVVMFYDYFGQGNRLYELGEVVSGEEDIEKLSGTITVAVYTE